MEKEDEQRNPELPSADWLAELQRPAAYPHRTGRIRLVVTHISWVLLAGRFAYKIKRPLALGFLDYSTLEWRHHFCQEELRLNRRLTDDLYLDVLPIVCEGGRLRLGGAGQPVEYAVRMRRPPGRKMLSRLLASDMVTREDVAAIGRAVARFHEQAERARASDPGGATTIRHNVREYSEQLRDFLSQTITTAQPQPLRTFTETFIEEHLACFEARKASGWVRDGHGDLRSDNICLHDGIQIFDCIEFNRRSRVAEIVAEVAFLTMDLDFGGHPDMTRAFVHSYADGLPDPALFTLLRFYQCYRAVGRAKVESCA